MLDRVASRFSPRPCFSINMADVESLFDFLHMELVAYFLNKPGKNIDVRSLCMVLFGSLFSC